MDTSPYPYIPDEPIMDQIVYQRTRKLFLMRAKILREQANQPIDMKDPCNSATEWVYTQQGLAALRRAFWKQPEIPPKPAVIMPLRPLLTVTDDVTAMGSNSMFAFDMGDPDEIADSIPDEPVSTPSVAASNNSVLPSTSTNLPPVVKNPFAINFDDLED